MSKRFSEKDIVDFVDEIIAHLEKDYFFHRDIYDFCPEIELRKELYDAALKNVGETGFLSVGEDFLTGCIEAVVGRNIEGVLDELIEQDEVQISLDKDGDFVYKIKSE